MNENVIGIIAGVLTTVRLLPQTYRSFNIKETKDLSSWFLFILFFQALFLILYGFMKPDYLIIYMNIVPLICSVVLIKLKLKYH